MSYFINKNIAKINNSELYVLINEVNKIEEDDEQNYIYLPLDELYEINKYISSKPKGNKFIDWLNTKNNNDETRQKLSCRKLSKDYFKEKGKSISATYIYYTLKNKLNLKYLKTAIKSKKLINNISIFLCNCFIKIISRAIKLGFNILYLDESIILSNNNKYRCWRKSDEFIYYNQEQKKELIYYWLWIKKM